MLAACEHRKNGVCSLYGIKAHWCPTCIKHPKYRDLWERGYGPGQPQDGRPIKTAAETTGPRITACELAVAAKRLATEINDPTIVEKTKSYTAALARWMCSGFKCRTDEEVAEIYRVHCQLCEKFDSEADVCTICGCPVLTEGMAIRNKLKMKTETCPKGKWK